MSAALPAVVFAGGRPLVYVSTLVGKRYATQWTLDRGASGDGLREFDFLTEIDPSAAGAGGSLIRQRSRLWCTGDCHPVRYVSDTSGARIECRFEEGLVTVRLPDGSSSNVPRAGADFLIDSNIPGQLALMFASLWRSGALARSAAVRTILFFVGQMTTVPCEIESGEDQAGTGLHLFRTSHMEEVWLDPNGLMREVRVPHVGFVATLKDPPPPAPDWPDDLTPDLPLLTYTPPAEASFRLEDVVVAGPVVPIGGTLSIPLGSPPFPGVLFVSGSGTHDRHGIAGEIDIGTHEILDGLAEVGFVGLRFDARGAGSTTFGADALDRGIASDIADARACLQLLRDRAETAGCPLFLIGHSQGGTEALALASEDGTRDDVRGVVLMATMGRDLDEVIADQIAEHGRVLGYSPEQVAQQVNTLREAVELARTGTPWKPGKVPDHVLAMFRTATWLREFQSYRAQDLIARVRCPVLVCQGGKDFQVSPERDAERLVTAARAAGVDCTYALFPELDHLFKRTHRSTLPEYNKTRPIDGEFLSTLYRWLAERAKPCHSDQIRTLSRPLR
jgi:hypothetical protein